MNLMDKQITKQKKIDMVIFYMIITAKRKKQKKNTHMREKQIMKRQKTQGVENANITKNNVRMIASIFLIFQKKEKENKRNKKMSEQKNELILIPKYEKYMEYMLQVIFKLPRTEKFNIGNEFKNVMYKMLENILYLNKIEISKRLYYLNLIDAELNTQRTMIRIMFKSHWIDEKKYKVSLELLYEIGKIVGGLIKFYAKNNKKSV